jgi:hypothetical protein
MRTPPAPRARRRAAAGALLLAALSACDAPEPTWRQRTAAQWAARLASRDAEDAEEARRALVAFAGKAPGVVVEAVAGELAKEAPPAVATPFALGVDREAAARLGLPDAASSEAARLDLPVLRARADALGLAVAAWRTATEGRIEVAVVGSRTRAEVERIQALLATRGALEVRPVLDDPAARPEPGRPAGKAYRGEVPHARRLEEEAARFAKAAAEGTRYVPADPRVRALPRPGVASPSGPADFLLVEEPPAGEEGLDDRMFAGASLDRALDGRPFVVARVRAERLEDAHRALAAAEGAAVAVAVDGVVKAVLPAPMLARDRIALPIWREGTAAADREATTLATVLASGRLERPLRPLPLGPDVGVGPPPENPYSVTLVEIGAPAVPALERLAATSPHEWTRRSAAWALGRLRR